MYTWKGSEEDEAEAEAEAEAEGEAEVDEEPGGVGGDSPEAAPDDPEPGRFPGRTGGAGEDAPVDINGTESRGGGTCIWHTQRQRV